MFKDTFYAYADADITADEPDAMNWWNKFVAWIMSIVNFIIGIFS